MSTFPNLFQGDLRLRVVRTPYLKGLVPLPSCARFGWKARKSLPASSSGTAAAPRHLMALGFQSSRCSDAQTGSQAPLETLREIHSKGKI